MMKYPFQISFFIFTWATAFSASAQASADTVGYGWSKTSVNTVVFRKNSLVTHGDVQYITYYDSLGYVVLGKREGKGNWKIRQTPYTGRVADAHNSISMMVDGDGYIHLAWDHHNSPLHYCRSLEPGSLELTEIIPMTGTEERDISYPEFYRLPAGDLIFLYRSGESGEGNLVMNRYDLKTKKWKRLQANLIDGEKQRNAYWQAHVDAFGTIHLSWVWRETWDVSTNHDLCYARSTDGGSTWEKTTGEKYVLPIRAAHAEYACQIAQNSELINQTSMYADSKGKPHIATYWRAPGGVPQYFIVYHDGNQWRQQQISNRTADFTLRGVGTKKIPISRPQLVIQPDGKMTLLFRAAERGNRVTALHGDLASGKWTTTDLTDYSVGDWEPTYDSELWRQKNVLHLFVQKTGQGDGEKMENMKPQAVTILKWP